MRKIWMYLGARLEMSTPQYRKLIKFGSVGAANLPQGIKITLDGDCYIPEHDVEGEEALNGVDVKVSSFSTYYPNKASACRRHFGKRELWARLGCTVIFTDEEFQQFMDSFEEDNNMVTLPKGVAIAFDGDAYIPEPCIRDKQPDYVMGDVALAVPYFGFMYEI